MLASHEPRASIFCCTLWDFENLTTSSTNRPARACRVRRSLGEAEGKVDILALGRELYSRSVADGTRELEGLFHCEYGRLVRVLQALSDDRGLAEEAVQDSPRQRVSNLSEDLEPEQLARLPRLRRTIEVG